MMAGHLAARPRRLVRTIGDRWPECPPLTDAERDEVHRRLDELAAAHGRRRDLHMRRLAKVAWHFSTQVGRGDCTVDAATGRLEALMQTEVTDSLLPMALVRYDIARDIVTGAYAAGIRESRHAS
jgi:hypothetical protein